MKVETAITVTLTDEERKAVQIVHNMLANLPICEVTDLNEILPTSISVESIREGLALIYERQLR